MGDVPPQRVPGAAPIATPARGHFLLRVGWKACWWRIVPHAVFCGPEVAAVGLSEAQARAARYDVAVGAQRFAAVAKARAR